MTELLRTLARPHRRELEKVKGSRFVGDAGPCADETEALAFVEQVRAREPDASHHCWAFHLEDGRERSSDDGEPAATAGAPILRRINGADLTDVVVVVTRWFGGTKLGTGGLVRAYGATAAAVLEDADVLERPVLATLALTHPYEVSGGVEGVLAAYDAIVVSSDYGTDVQLRVTVPRASVDSFTHAMTEATSGRVRPEAI